MTAVALYGGAYKLPEQSLNSLALGAAYVAHTEGADTAYFNPAAMVFMPEGDFVDGALTLVHLPANKYILRSPYSGNSKVENIVIPGGHYMGKTIGAFRWGVSLVAPAGLTKRWKSPYQKLYAEEFTLKNIELNPSFAYKVNERFAIGGGVRMVYSKGEVYSDGGNIAPIKREMEGDTIAFGYNLALLYKPTTDINLAVTYRSNIDLKEEGEANLYFGGVGKQYKSDVTVPIPATLVIGLSKTWQQKYTVEFDYERTFWSSYKRLDFGYERPISNPILKSAFDDPLARNWKDTDTYRIGATAKIADAFTVMAGIAVDQTPVPSRTIGFELPDSDAKIFSAGFRYRAGKHLSWGAGVLYDRKEKRTLAPDIKRENSVLKNGGRFKKGGAIVTTVGISYEY